MTGRVDPMEGFDVVCRDPAGERTWYLNGERASEDDVRQYLRAVTATCRHCGGEIVSCADAIPYCRGWKHAAYLHYGPVGPHYCEGRSVNPMAEPGHDPASGAHHLPR